MRRQGLEPRTRGLRVRCSDSLAVLRRPLAQVTRLCGLRRTAPDVGELQLKLQRGARLAETNSTPQFPLGPMADALDRVTGGRADPPQVEPCELPMTQLATHGL